jgi:hypothetical protein
VESGIVLDTHRLARDFASNFQSAGTTANELTLLDLFYTWEIMCVRIY